MKQFYEFSDEIQVCIDEAGRGPLIGPVVAAAVIWNPDIINENIKDSKKLSRKKRNEIRLFIEENAIAYGVGFASNDEIDEINILNATYLAMHRALDQIKINFDRILVDGDKFQPYLCKPYTCIIGGDNQYTGIAAASILAKENHDDWIKNNFKDDNKYNLLNCMGYGTKKHIEAIRQYGLTPYHRKSFCSKYI